MERTTGKVKWFSQEKGFGFVTRDDGTDVFVHHTGISGRGFKTLEQGERVEFEIIEEPKGLKASNLVRLDAPAGQPAGMDGGYGGGGYGRDEGYGTRDDGYGNRNHGGYGDRDGGYGNRNAGYGDRGYGARRGERDRGRGW